MKFSPTLRYLLLSGLCLLLAGCAGERTVQSGAGSAAADFSGSWELDYSQSDTVRDRYESVMRELRRQAERRARGGGMSQAGGTVGVTGAGSGAGLYDLARMAELVTASQLLEISQGENDILVKREGNFALECEFYPGQFHRTQSPFGDEACGWDDHQLVFVISLPEGLSIHHRFTLGPQGERLGVATALRSSGSPYPFTLNMVYNRFDPEDDGIRCEQTLTRGRVCTTESR